MTELARKKNAVGNEMVLVESINPRGRCFVRVEEIDNRRSHHRVADFDFWHSPGDANRFKAREEGKKLFDKLTETQKSEFEFKKGDNENER